MVTMAIPNSVVPRRTYAWMTYRPSSQDSSAPQAPPTTIAGRIATSPRAAA